jgi:hypothetical protein
VADAEKLVKGQDVAVLMSSNRLLGAFQASEQD